MPRARPAIRASPSGRWLTLKSRYQNTRAKVKTTARARAVARIRVKTRAKEREAARPTEASRSSNQTPAWPYWRGAVGISWGVVAPVAISLGRDHLLVFPVDLCWSAPVKNSRTGQSLSLPSVEV